MTMEEMVEEVVDLSKKGDAQFLELARALRELHDTLADDPEGSKLNQFDKCLAKAKIGRRRAYYLIDIDLFYTPLKLSRKRLSAIGWTKLGFMAKHIDPEDIEDWLERAETGTVDELRAYIAGQEPPTNILSFKLTEKQYGIVAGTLLGNGAYLTGGAGLGNKEAALVKVCRTVGKAWKAGIF